jgi:hypothetical protein
VMLNGVQYFRSGTGYDEMSSGGDPTLAKFINEMGVRPEHFAYTPEHGNLLRADVYTPLMTKYAATQKGGLTDMLTSMPKVLGGIGMGMGLATGFGSGQGILSSLSSEGFSLPSLGGDNTFLNNSFADNGGTLTDAGTPGVSGLSGEQAFSGATASGSTSGPFSNIGNMITKPFTSVGNLISGNGSSDDLKTLGTAASLAGGAAALGGAVSGGLGGSTTQTSTTSVPGMTAEERELIGIYTQLAKRQLSAVDELQPFQKKMLEMSLAEMERQLADDQAISGAITPAERAAAARDEFDRTQRLGPINDEILQMQLDTLRRGGAASPEQKAAIGASTDSAIAAGYGDIDAATGRGIGLIADELSNARGLRLSDSPMSSEAALLSREGLIQKGSLEKNLRANQANAELNYPLGVAQLTSQIGGQQQGIAANAKQFAEELRQRAFQNRMALTNSASSTGLGLASTNGGGGALSALTNQRLAGASTTTNVSRSLGLSDLGNLASGIGGAMSGFSRLFG